MNWACMKSQYDLCTVEHTPYYESPTLRWFIKRINVSFLNLAPCLLRFLADSYFYALIELTQRIDSLLRRRRKDLFRLPSGRR